RGQRFHGIGLAHFGQREQQRYAFFLSFAIGRRNRGAPHGLRLYGSCEFAERKWLMMRVFLVLLAGRPRVEFWRQAAVFKTGKVAEQSLFMQGMRSETGLFGRCLETIADGLVDLDAQGGRRHKDSPTGSAGYSRSAGYSPW